MIWFKCRSFKHFFNEGATIQWGFAEYERFYFVFPEKIKVRNLNKSQQASIIKNGQYLGSDYIDEKLETAVMIISAIPNLFACVSDYI